MTTHQWCFNFHTINITRFPTHLFTVSLDIIKSPLHMTPYIFLDYYTTCNNLTHHILLLFFHIRNRCRYKSLWNNYTMCIITKLGFCNLRYLASCLAKSQIPWIVPDPNCKTQVLNIVVSTSLFGTPLPTLT